MCYSHCHYSTLLSLSLWEILVCFCGGFLFSGRALSMCKLLISTSCKHILSGFFSLLFTGQLLSITHPHIGELILLETRRKHLEHT